MSHYHCEIVMPPTSDVKAAVEQIMKPFNENADGDEASSYRFWDFWVIGGRWAGTKAMAALDKTKIEQFYAELKARNVTVSGVQFGKQELHPAAQIPMVDALWNEMFPEYGGGACPIFRHSNDQHKSESHIRGDVMNLSDVPASLTCSRLIFAGPDYDGNGCEATAMFSDEIWNGVNYERTDWDGTFGGAMKKIEKKFDGYSYDYRARVTPKSYWIVVTVDYHS